MRVSRVLGMGLVTLRVTETVKELLPVVPSPPAKSIFAAAVGVGLSATLGERNAAVMLVEGVAAAGLASLLHDGQDAARRFTDNQIMGVISQRPRRAEPLGAR